MRSHKQGAKPSKNTIQMPVPTGKEVDVEKQQHEQHVNQLISTWSKETEYEEGLPGELVQRAMSNFSDLNLQMPWELYKAISEKANAIDNVNVRFTFHEMNAVLQIVGMCSAKQLEYNLAAYIAFKERLIEIGANFDKALNENKARIREENTHVTDMAVNMVGEA